MCRSNLVKQDAPIGAKSYRSLTSLEVDDSESPILPGLPDDVAKYCLALVPHSDFPAMGGVCKKWRYFLQSKELITVRQLAGLLEEWLYVLTTDSEGKENHWEVLDCHGHKHHVLPPMPGPTRFGFGVAVLNGKLLVVGGYSAIPGTTVASEDVYQYDSCLNSERKSGDKETKSRQRQNVELLSYTTLSLSLHSTAREKQHQPATMFGAQSSSSPFGTPSSTPAFGTPSSTPAFGTPSSTPAFGTPSSTPAFGMPSSTPSFFTPSAPAPAFGTPSTSAFSTGGFGSLFNTPFSSQTQQQQQQTQSFQQPQSAGGFGFQSPFTTPQQPTPFPKSQLTTQMAPVAPLPFSLADRDIQAIVDAYKDEPGNPKYAFKHLLFSVTDPQFRVKPAGVSDIMWAEAMAKLEGLESTDRERLWPQLVQGFKDLSQRLKLQDEVLLSDAERLQMTQSNVKMLQRHFQADTLPWIERMRQKEQGLQRRLLRVMRILEALEGKGFRLPLMKGEVELAEKLAAVTRQVLHYYALHPFSMHPTCHLSFGEDTNKQMDLQLKGSGAELTRRVQNLLTISRVQENSIGAGALGYLPGSTKIHEQSLAAMQEVLQQQTEAIARLGNVLKRDIRDMEIIMAEDTETTENGS
ncbi:hypothetical protein DVH24_041037 [Malus domestica]|uniref:F-box domain-containing protein n=1 Tax=Malus domestica TaxID=3750 RepID=A0A498I9Q2_MALDO|nr:hypothetical protein DVH24_041037 [Malus domestica]